MKKILLPICLLICTVMAVGKPLRVVSPNGRLSLEQQGRGYVVSCEGQQVLHLSQVGVTTSTIGEGLTFRRLVKRGKMSKKSIQSFTDSGDSASPWVIRTIDRLPSSVSCQPRGGFVYVIQRK